MFVLKISGIKILLYFKLLLNVICFCVHSLIFFMFYLYFSTLPFRLRTIVIAKLEEKYQNWEQQRKVQQIGQLNNLVVAQNYFTF